MKTKHIKESTACKIIFFSLWAKLTYCLSLGWFFWYMLFSTGIPVIDEPPSQPDQPEPPCMGCADTQPKGK